MARLSQVQLTRLCRRVATSIDAGLDDRSIWASELNAAPPNKRFGFQIILDHISDGGELAEGMRKAKPLFPEMMCDLVETGEAGGRLGETFHRLSDHFDKLVRMRRSFISGIAWPVFELTVAITIVGVLILALGVVGQMTGETLDLFGLGLGTAGNFTLYVTVVLLLLAAVFVPAYGLMKNWFGTTPLRVAHRIPLIGTTIEVLCLSRLAWTLGMAIDAGMDVIRSTQLALRATQNPLYTEQHEQIASGLRKGDELHTTFSRTGVFPDDFVLFLENGELTGQVPESMDRLSREYQEKAERLFKSISAIGGVLVMIFIAGIIVAMIFFLFFRLIYSAYAPYMLLSELLS